MELNLVNPTDFQILECLDERGRNNAVNIAVILDHDRTYMNARLSALVGKGCVQRVGPAENSGLYEITTKGEVALEYRGAHGDPEKDFAALVEASLAKTGSGKLTHR